MTARWLQRFLPATALFVSLLPVSAAGADSRAQVVRDADKSTLDQDGTHPFHLRATLAPSFPRDAASNRTGEVEIWWQSPRKWRREVRSPEFHQLLIVNEGQIWQKNEGKYFPEWLRETAEALVQPLSKESAARKGIRPDKESTSVGSLYLNWEKELPIDRQLYKQVVSIRLGQDLLSYDGGLGWGGFFDHYAPFHGKMIARTVTGGSPEVKATVVVLEDLAEPTDLFSVEAVAGSAPIDTVIVDKMGYVEDLQSGTASPAWPAVVDGPLKGVVWTEMAVDREGVPHEVMNAISDNPAINGVATEYFKGLRFRPVLRDGLPVQVVRRVAIPFVLSRPVGMADLGTAKDAFERGRKSSVLSSAATAPYVLKAKVSIGITGSLVEGTYIDTWRDRSHWRREAVLGGSRFVRAQDGDKQYLLEEGSNARAARFVLTAVEPIPTTDTMTESDWRLQKVPLEEKPTLRVMRGPLMEDGMPDLSKAWPFWFDENSTLLQTYASSLVLSYGKPKMFDGIQVPMQIDGHSASGKLIFRLSVEELRLARPEELGNAVFRVPGHDWKRQFTAEVR